MKKQLAIATALPSIGILLIALFLYFHDRTQTAPIGKTAARNSSSTASMIFVSPYFKNNESIPAKFTCEGSDINPALEISNVPENAKSLALIMDDPDALARPKPGEGGPGGAFTHWTVWNIDPRIAIIKEESKPPESVEGVTDFGRVGYGGPCPPSGTHHYHFKLYALDATLDLPSGAPKKMLEQEIQKHLIAKAELIGLYKREK